MSRYIIQESFKFKYHIAPFGVALVCDRYAFDMKQKALHIRAIDDNEPLATASVMLEGYPQADNEIYIKTWSENEGLMEELILHGIIEPPHGTIQAGFCQAAICVLNIPLSLWETIQ